MQLKKHLNQKGYIKLRKKYSYINETSRKHAALITSKLHTLKNRDRTSKIQPYV